MAESRNNIAISGGVSSKKKSNFSRVEVFGYKRPDVQLTAVMCKKCKKTVVTNGCTISVKYQLPLCNTSQLAGFKLV